MASRDLGVPELDIHRGAPPEIDPRLVDLEHCSGLRAGDHRQREAHVPGERRQLGQLWSLGFDVHLVGRGDPRLRRFGRAAVDVGGVRDLVDRVVDAECVPAARALHALGLGTAEAGLVVPVLGLALRTGDDQPGLLADTFNDNSS